MNAKIPSPHQDSIRDTEWRGTRSVILDLMHAQFVQHGLWGITGNQLRRLYAARHHRDIYNYFTSVSDLEAAYLVYRSGLADDAQKAIAYERTCLAAWRRYQRARAFDIAE